MATAALSGVTEAAMLAGGYAPVTGFLHSGNPQGFVYDIADMLEFKTVVPEAFRVAAAARSGKPLGGRPVADPVAEVRRRYRDAFRRAGVLARLIPLMEKFLVAGGSPAPEPGPDAVPVAFEGWDRRAMLAIVVENAPPCSRGRLAAWLPEVQAGVFVAAYGRRLRAMVRVEVCAAIDDGNAVSAWDSRNEAGYEVDTRGPNRRVPRGMVRVPAGALRPRSGVAARRRLGVRRAAG